ncbi:polysaccharide lyase 6 family protein [Carboxylicivirga sp. M1479]|uniref:polysaccharide lyase 6 family protein n=1 Tax=Carboxylicivirga sp. M1479 TaxID=2594476 RepID=UPI001178A96D|nr:polysaccharide lyase 6 family protein [Carboxylicivirga sp. M1479]TRX72641.1 hypothetical protein FNN09_01490 [Carboxylicivirga sp. M1479]
MKRVLNYNLSSVNKNKSDNRHFVLLTLVVFMLLNFGSLGAKNYIINTSSELSAISSSLNPGDTVKLSARTWTNEELLFTGVGTKENNIVLSVESKQQTILTGSSKLRIYGEYLTVDGLRFENGYSDGGAVVEFRKSSSQLATNCRLTNTSILNYNPADKDEDYKWVSVYGVNNRVDHCHFEGKEHSGTTLVIWIGDEPNYHSIDHNYFGARPDLGYNGGEAIRIGTSSNSMKESRTIVEYNLFEACDGEIEIISNKSCFNTYRYNTFRNNDGCLTLRHGNDCEVYGNYFVGENKSSGGVRIIGERHKVYNNYFEGLKGDDYRSAICLMNGVPNSPLNRYFQVKDAVVAFNTIVNCKMPISIGTGEDSEKTLPPLDCVMANNVIDKTSGSNNITIEDEPINMLWEGNVINADASDESVNGGISFVNPNLENKAYMWRPSASNVLLGSAVGNYEYVATDIEEQSRDENKTIGCDNGEVSADWYPLNKEDVGPYSGTQEEDVSIASITEVNDMVIAQMENEKCHFKILKEHYRPIKYLVSDLSGRLIAQGELGQKLTIDMKEIQMYLVIFYSENQYVQRYKLLKNQINRLSN